MILEKKNYIIFSKSKIYTESGTTAFSKFSISKEIDMFVKISCSSLVT